MHDLLAETNGHVSETSADREPWVWILETLFAEISSGNYRHPYAFRELHAEGEPHEVLLIRAQHVMHHLGHSVHLRDTWNGLPVKSDRVLKRQLLRAGVVLRERVDTTIQSRRECHMLALSLHKLEEYGLHPSLPEQLEVEFAPPPSSALGPGPGASPSAVPPTP
jgi:hypothetical protein